MGVISREAMDLFRKVRDQYPETYEWAKHKARWEGIPIGAVFMDYPDYIRELMAREDGVNDGRIETVSV